jgi:hypothetical protein
MLLGLAAAALGLGFGQPAAAGGWDDTYPRYGTVYVHHHFYAPVRYKHVYHLHVPGPTHVHVVHDPYAWSYKPVGYYPYYGSAYWVPRAYMRYRYRYYPAWGYPLYRPYKWYWAGRHYW